MMTPKKTTINVLGRELAYFNQKSREWTHPYVYEDPTATLSSSGCGIFALCHAAQFLTGVEQAPEKWADFSMANGGRGDDGTDRPALLGALQTTGAAKELGFFYEFDGLRNDTDTLYDFLLNEQGVSLCNLRVGHIVALVAAREVDGVKQVLAIDSVAESASEKVRDHVAEIIPGTENTYPIRNKADMVVGTGTSFAAFWVTADTPKDFNLLHRL